MFSPTIAMSGTGTSDAPWQPPCSTPILRKHHVRTGGGSPKRLRCTLLPLSLRDENGGAATKIRTWRKGTWPASRYPLKPLSIEADIDQVMATIQLVAGKDIASPTAGRAKFAELPPPPRSETLLRKRPPSHHGRARRCPWPSGKWPSRVLKKGLADGVMVTYAG